MESKPVYFLVAIISMVVVGMNGGAEGAISCSMVVSDVVPCLSYVSGSAAQPTQGCCNGIRSLNSGAKTTADRQAVCNCIKSAASSYQSNYARIGKLPAACGVNLGFAITPSLNCATIR
ncbi:hypothetical protein SUGI_0999650 [Cryptomeria japonica]|uniref:non-specific lipid-transfer protein n=1 Tax=Cryptomeria japonica TaxID=3369 RepID=UPI002414BDAE|nr:non-specific lipid-transfer protein [Cryptomeria japonica]GLJ47361.1 hypothetical protein SUGI_0999650 [Cryptomeria japonica]